MVFGCFFLVPQIPQSIERFKMPEILKLNFNGNEPKTNQSDFKNQIEIEIENPPIFIVKVIKNTTTQKNFNNSEHYSYRNKFLLKHFFLKRLSLKNVFLIFFSLFFI